MGIKIKKHYDFLFVDYMVEDQHKAYCNALINSINECCSSVAIVKDGYLNYQQDDKHAIFYINTKEVVGNYPIKARINTQYNFKESKKIIDNYLFDKVIVLGYDPVMFSIEYSYLFKQGTVYLVEHHQLDEIVNNPTKTRLWKKYGTKVNHILLDESIIYEAHNKLNIDCNKMMVFPHPLLQKKEKTNALNQDKTIILCISNSNEISQIKAIADLERAHHVFEHNNYEIVIRDEFNVNTEGTNCFKKIHGFLDKKNYDALYNNSDIILMAFPTSYNMRCSGSLIDAMALGKKVISSNIAESRQYANMFNGICRTYDNIKEIPNIIRDLRNSGEIDQFEDFHKYQISLKEKGIKKILS